MAQSFNSTDIISLIRTLTAMPSPSGYTQSITDWLKNWLTERQIPFEQSNKGAIIIMLKGKDHKRARLVTAHLDTLGAMVKTIKTDGRLQLSKVGGFNWNATEGEYCTIHTPKNNIRGTILVHQTSPHVYRNSGDIARDDDNMEVRIDAKTQSKAETIALGISVGDFISFDPRFETTDTGFIKSRHLDDKASAAILLSLLESIIKKSVTLPHTTYLYFSNNEEIGYGGNSNIPNNTVEYIAVDMGALGDGQNSDEYHVSICAKDSSGPYHHALTQQLRQLAETHKIPFKMDIYPFYGSDASAAMRAGHDLRHALFGPGIESSHALERTHLDSLKASYDLLREYLLSEMI